MRRARPGKSLHRQLVASIRRHGVLHDLVVVPLTGTPDRYGVVAGARRPAAVDGPVGKGEMEPYEAPYALGETGKAALVAIAVSSTLDADTVREDGTVTRVLVKQVDFDAARWWRPIASNFLKRVNRAQLRATGKKRCGSDWNVQHARDRRGMLVDALDALFNDEAEHEGLGPKVRNHIDAWLAA